MRLELLHHLMAFVDEREPCALASSVLCSEPEAGYLVFVCFVELRELLAEFVFGDVGAVGVEDVSAAREAPSAHFRLTYTTICFRPRRALRINLRVRSVTGCSRSAIFAGWRILSVQELAWKCEDCSTDSKMFGVLRWLVVAGI